ncbi:MAG: SDR family NAD(P)-dependent oxidoreductase [Pseudomonadota bacterium]|nr:SDR family NAD(P)-dependent oxidoreductase [Pseudomonadota bacterium]
MTDTALVIGATSSLAQAICRSLARKGYRLILAGRDERELELLAADLSTRFQAECLIQPVDLLDSDFSPETFIESVGDFSHVVIAVGDMSGDLAHIARINYLLPADLAEAAAQRLADRKRGSIAIISSVAGDRGRQSNYAYGSAKAALTCFASGLRNRCHKQGVHVLTVKPGFVDTPMTWGMKSPLIASRDYVAEKIVHAMEKKKNVLYVPFFWRFIMLIICHIPEPIFKRLSL